MRELSFQMKEKSLSADLIAISGGLCGIVLLFGLMQNDRPVFCVSAGDIELEEEVWTCGVDRFSQCVKKFESKAIVLQTSALSELSLLSSAGGEQFAMLPVHIEFFFFFSAETT